MSGPQDLPSLLTSVSRVEDIKISLKVSNSLQTLRPHLESRDTHGYCALQAADTLSHWPRDCRSRIQDRCHHTASAVLSLRVTDSSSLLALTCNDVHRVVPTREDHASLGIQSVHRPGDINTADGVHD